MKSEPAELSIHDLKRKKCEAWTGVRNYEARNFMRDRMCIGDLIIFYHSNGTPSGVAGVAKVASKPYPDTTQFDPSSHYFDPKSTPEKPIWELIDVRFVKAFPRVIPRDELYTVRGLANMTLWKRNRLSITPLTEKEFSLIVKYAEKKLGR